MFQEQPWKEVRGSEGLWRDAFEVQSPVIPGTIHFFYKDTLNVYDMRARCWEYT